MRPHSTIERLLRPTTIAVVGGKPAAAVIRQCAKIGYTGTIWPVNPKRSEIEGLRCFASIADLPAAPDATFIAVPPEATIEVVASLAKRGAGGAVCFASGFAEAGSEGAAHQRRLQSAMGDLALIGPNCYGLINYLDGVALWPDEQGSKRIEHGDSRKHQGVAILTQSGNIALNLSMQQRSLPLAYLISTGNQAGVTISELVDVLLEDKRVNAIGIHLEGVSDVAAFSQVARKALHKRLPIVVIKSGASELASQVMISHTNSLAGAVTLYDALFQRMGIVRVHSIPQFLETLKFLSLVGPLPTASIASISCSGGEAGLVADGAAAHGLTMPPLYESQRLALFNVLGEKVALSNPLDYHTYIWGDEEAQYRCFSAMLLGEQAITLKILDYPRPDLCDTQAWDQTGRAFARAVVDAGKTGVVVATMAENLPEAARDRLLEYGVAPMLGLEECLVAIKGASFVYAKQMEVGRIAPLLGESCLPFPSPPPSWEGTDQGEMEDAPSVQNTNQDSSNRSSSRRLIRGEVRLVSEHQSKSRLQAYGLPVPRSIECDVRQTALAASEIGFPLVVKVSSQTIMHKSEVGGVHLNLRSVVEVEEAVAQMRLAGLGDRLLVEAMAPKPLVELILGVRRDRRFGLVLVVGTGGALVELLRDSVTLLFPVQRFEVEAALDQLRIAPLFNGYRGFPRADKGAVIDAVMNLAHFAEKHIDRIVEVDINPLFVFEEGVLAVDAVIREIGE